MKTKINGKLQELVHCHICPLKDICEVGNAEDSYRYHHEDDIEYNYTTDELERFRLSTEPETSDRGKIMTLMILLRHITLCCPLKEILEDG